jgi:hypothetical protein
MQKPLEIRADFADVPPAGLGKNPGPLTGAYIVLCHEVTIHHKHADWYPMLLEVKDGMHKQSVGTQWTGIRLERPHNGLKEGGKIARTRSMKKCKVSFADGDPARISAAHGDNLGIKLDTLSGKTGRIWWERGNPESDGDQGFGKWKFVDEKEYGQILSGEVTMELFNTPLRGIPGQAGPGVAQYPTPAGPSAVGAAPSGTGGPFVASSPAANGAGGAVAPPVPVVVQQAAPAPDASASML